MIAIVDAGPLYAAADQSDQHHQASVNILSSTDFQLFVPVLAAAEAIYLVGSRLGPLAEALFVEGLLDLNISAPTVSEWTRIAELIRIYRSFPLGAADASVVALAERLNSDLLITFDLRHFRAIRPTHVPAFQLLPDGFNSTR
jgi:predicted nucleic acid-binding protein